MTAPLIGISVQRSVEASAFGPRDSALQVMEYAESVVAAGGRPVLLPATEQIHENLLEGIDGLVLSGGGDLSPEMYGESPEEKTYGVSVIRDRYETALIEDAERRGTPVFAICRGLQLINVLRGGSLHQHIDDHWQTGPSASPMHSVEVDPSSRLRDIVGTGSLPVNSYHHQAIDRLGRGLTPVAYSDDLIEAFEDPEHSILGVQWHPEHMSKTSSQNLALFEDLIQRASTFHERKES